MGGKKNQTYIRRCFTSFSNDDLHRPFGDNIDYQINQIDVVKY